MKTNRLKFMFIALIGLTIIIFGVVISMTKPESDARENLGGFGLLLLAALFYLLPAYQAYQNEHHNREAIAVLNIVAGWTIIGWIVALVWAFTKPRQS